MIKIRCPYCGIDYQAEDQDVGLETDCESCGAKFVIKEEPPGAAPRQPATPMQVRIVRNEDKVDAVRVTNIDITVNQMIILIFKFMFALILVNLFFGTIGLIGFFIITQILDVTL